MIKLHRTSQDATGFIDTVEAVATGMLRESASPRFVAVQIDNWFDQKWLRFSGKMLGAFGVWKSGEHLTLPPFVPNRVLSEAWWARAPEEDDFRWQEESTPLHSRMWPEQNRNRGVASTVGGATLLWYSGNSIAAGRGAIMVYEALEAGYRCWYASLAEFQMVDQDKSETEPRREWIGGLEILRTGWTTDFRRLNAIWS